MLKSISVANKLLCIVKEDKNVYIGDARGRILKLSSPFKFPKVIYESDGPVSTIFFLDSKMYHGTWDGIISDGIKSKKLGTDPIKCGISFKNMLFVSVDSKLIILDSDLKILEEIETKSKIFCMDKFNEMLQLGTGDGDVLIYQNSVEESIKTGHDSTVLSIKGSVTGSTDCSVRKDGKLIFKEDNWIRAIWDENLFSSGKQVFENGKSLYSHKDEVTGIVKVGNKIISIGLDYSINIYEKEFSITESEERELLELLNS